MEAENYISQMALPQTRKRWQKIKESFFPPALAPAISAEVLPQPSGFQTAECGNSTALDGQQQLSQGLGALAASARTASGTLGFRAPAVSVGVRVTGFPQSRGSGDLRQLQGRQCPALSTDSPLLSAGHCHIALPPSFPSTRVQHFCNQFSGLKSLCFESFLFFWMGTY